MKILLPLAWGRGVGSSARLGVLAGNEVLAGWAPPGFGLITCRGCPGPNSFDLKRSRSTACYPLASAIYLAVAKPSCAGLRWGRGEALGCVPSHRENEVK